LISLEKFFRADFSEVVGVYFDGETIFLSRNEESLSAYFEIEEENFAEQLAEKVLLMCNKQGWDTPKIALCLREVDSTVIQADFENIPAERRESAVKSWATAQVGENALYTFAEIGGDYWAETIPTFQAERFVAAFEKNSMTLCAMTQLAGKFSDSADKASYISKFATEKNFPNLLKTRLSDWNFSKIFAAVVGIFFISAATIFGQMFYKNFTLHDELETLQKKIALQNDSAILNENFKSNTAESNRLNELLATQFDKTKLNILINLGKISDEKIHLTQINFAEDFAEIEGFAKDSADVKKYLGNFKNKITKNAKLEKISTEDDKVIFKIRLTVFQLLEKSH